MLGKWETSKYYMRHGGKGGPGVGGQYRGGGKMRGGEDENQQKQIVFENALIHVKTSTVYANSKLLIRKNQKNNISHHNPSLIFLFFFSLWLM